MTKPDFLTTNTGRRLAYHQTQGTGPGIVFLGGLNSDMAGTKALYLEEWAGAAGRAFLRFDYSGHGQSSGKFIDGCVGDWAADAMAAISELTEGPQVLVGSSLGGWISLLVARTNPTKVCGLVGIAAAADFTEDSIWNGFSDAQKAEMADTGHVALPSDYSDEPYIITRHMIEDGRKHLVLRDPLLLNFPVRLLHGTADTDVDMSVGLRTLDHAEGDDIRLTFVKGADHRMSTPEILSLIRKSIHSVDMSRAGR